MRPNSRSSWIALAALGLAACSLQVEPQPAPSAAPEHIVLEHAGDLGGPLAALSGAGLGYRTGVDVRSSPCHCTTDECLIEWLESQLGCGVCMTYVCPGRSHHMCLECEPSPARHESSAAELSIP